MKVVCWPKGPNTANSLEAEARRYHDLVRLDLIDGYAQLSRKVDRPFLLTLF